MNEINSESIICLNYFAVSATGGLFGIRDLGVLNSSVKEVYQTFEGEELYPTIEEKSARTCYNLISSHPFVDGNKRTGLLTMLSLLLTNGIKVKCSDVELIKIGLSLAKGKMGYEDLLGWVNSNKEIIKTVEK